MKFLFKFLIIALIAVSIALVAREDPGYVMIAREPWVVEISLALFVALGLVLFGILYFGIRFVVVSWSLPGRTRAWNRHRRAVRARKTLTKGLVELAERHWESAEKSLVSHVDDSETPLLNYLAAACAAQEQGAHGRRDQYLFRAHESMPAADVAVGLTQADLQMRHRQMEQALATLMHLRQVAPKHAHVLKLLAKLYVALRDWTHLRELLPELRKRKVVDEERFEELERMVHTELLHDAAGSADPQALHQGWSDVPRRLRTSEPLVTTYAEGLIKQGYHETAANLLRDALKKSWNEQLVYLYGMIESSDPAKQLAHAEDWLKHHERDPVLLLALGRLCVRNELWGKARMYLEASIGAGARPDTYRALGELLERMNERQEAAECYRKGLLLADEAEKPRTVGRALAGRGAPDPAKLLSPG